MLCVGKHSTASLISSPYQCSVNASLCHLSHMFFDYLYLSRNFPNFFVIIKPGGDSGQWPKNATEHRISRIQDLLDLYVKCEMRTVIDDINNDINQRKFLLIPINPPIFDRRVLASIFHNDLVTSTSCSKLIMIPLKFFLPLKPISFAWYLFILQGTEHFLRFPSLILRRFQHI